MVWRGWVISFPKRGEKAEAGLCSQRRIRRRGLFHPSTYPIRQPSVRRWASRRLLFTKPPLFPSGTPAPRLFVLLSTCQTTPSPSPTSCASQHPIPTLGHQDRASPLATFSPPRCLLPFPSASCSKGALSTLFLFIVLFFFFFRFKWFWRMVFPRGGIFVYSYIGISLRLFIYPYAINFIIFPVQSVSPCNFIYIREKEKIAASW